jgi:DNA invertase Pin-like site-specific DNA recombinase
MSFQARARSCCEKSRFRLNPQPRCRSTSHGFRAALDPARSGQSARTSARTILGGLADFERTLIRTRTGEGRERAKAKNVRFGRPLKLSPHQRRAAVERLKTGESV